MPLINVLPGENVRSLLEKEGFPFVCVGRGVCGKCKIKVLSGEVCITDADRAFFTSDELESGMRLACCIKEASVPLLVEYDSSEDTIYVPAEDSKTALEADEIRTNKLTGTIEHERHDNEESDYAERLYSLAIDIGTTTIAVSAVDITDGTVLGTQAGINHQRSFGADVISRIVASNNGNAALLRDIVIGDINSLIDKLVKQLKLSVANLQRIALAGNTTMLHIFAGYSCEGLGVAPFRPVSIDLVSTDSGTLLPGISTYVGADILAGLYSLELDDELSLFIDLGTNGEMALGNSKRLLVTSTAAGPAFEGGNISCGTASISGAITDAVLSDKDGEQPIKLTTVNDEAPIGICGTGVISIVSELLRKNLIDSTGLLDDRLHGRIKLTADGKITFTQKDIREIQLAKAAVRAGIETLLFTFGAEYEDVMHVYIAGGFGTKLDTAKACRLGIIPEELSDVCEAVGNTSLKGVIKYLVSKNGAEELESIKANAKEVVLADNAYFTSRFMEEMHF